MPLTNPEREALLSIAETFERIGRLVTEFARRDSDEPIPHRELTAVLQSIAKSMDQIQTDIARMTQD
jgi:hypothetical protein